jgi:hypothetical protein
MLRYMAEDNGELIAVMGTVDHPNIGWKTKADPLFLKFDKEGNITKKNTFEILLTSTKVISLLRKLARII